ncbi:MAG TPA: lipoprotein [Steroidobacteraceae bacterium]|nr:lipoprotein [Steroidobacteraceae bacterium]
MSAIPSAVRAGPLRRALLAAAAGALLLGGCGQKGPLYLPNAQKAPVMPTPGAATPSVVPAEPTPLAPAANPPNPGAAGAPASQTPRRQPQQPQQPHSLPGQPGPAQPDGSQSAPDGSPSTGGGNSPAA